MAVFIPINGSMSLLLLYTCRSQDVIKSALMFVVFVTVVLKLIILLNIIYHLMLTS